MAGLIQQQLGDNLIKLKAPDDSIAQAAAVGVDPNLRTVDAAKESVAGQLDSLLKSGSPLLERAKAGAMQTANSRGLINSTMASQAGEAAMMDAALPIATADANVYGTAVRENQAAGNTALQFNAGAGNASSLQAAQAANVSGLSKQTAGQDIALQTLKGQQAQTLAQIEAQYKDYMQASASSSQLFATTSKNISDILNDPNTSVAQKQSAVDFQTQILKNGMAVIGGIAQLNLGSLLDFSGAPQPVAGAPAAPTGPVAGFTPPRISPYADQASGP